jgi:8-amino-7-oxononanoate synthase
MLERRLQQHLNERIRAGNLRTLTIKDHPPADFCSNDYLGLARSQTLRRRIEEAAADLPDLPNGATGSRLISGNHRLAEETENHLAQVFRAESCLLFNSGYAANSAILSTVPQKGDLIFCDELIHASLREGARLSYAQRYSFRHNDLGDLEKKIQYTRQNNSSGEVFIVAESVYSMDGDFGPLEALLNLCEQYNAHLIWDEAHSTGIWGENGNGLACLVGLHNRIFARIYTFGKAMGVHGACVAGSAILSSYLVNFARGFIYTTAMPLHSLISIRESFAYLAENPALPAVLFERIRLFHQALGRSDEDAAISQSPIQVLKVGGNEATKTLAAQLQQAGFDVRAILSPTVRAGEERLRICLHAHNSAEEVQQLGNWLRTHNSQPAN